MMPSYPAFILLLASLVFLFPGRHAHASRPRNPRAAITTSPTRGDGSPLLGAGAALFALYPLALVAAASPMHGPQPRVYQPSGSCAASTPPLRLTATVSGRRVHLHWNVRNPHGNQFFYRIWRSNAADGGATCTPVPHAADNCQLAMDDLGAHRGGHFVDKPGRGRWTYRLGLAANWLNSPLYGDVFSLGPPLVVRVH